MIYITDDNKIPALKTAGEMVKSYFNNTEDKIKKAILECKSSDSQEDGFEIKYNSGEVTITGENPRSVLYGVHYLKDHLDKVVEEGNISLKPALQRRVGTLRVGPGYADSVHTEEHMKYLSRITCNGVYISFLLNKGLSELGQSEIYPKIQEKMRSDLINDTEIERIIDLAEKYGLDVYISMNDPHYLTKEAFQEYPEIPQSNIHWGNYNMCFTDDRVRRHYYECTRNLFETHPRLKGLIVYSGDGGAYLCNTPEIGLDEKSIPIKHPCPRCTEPAYRRRADFWNLVNKASKEIKPDAEMIAMIWHDTEGIGQTIPMLTTDIPIARRIDEGIPQTINGNTKYIYDMTLAEDGPGEWFIKSMEGGKKVGLRGMAQIGICCNNEFDMLPSTIAPGVIYNKVKKMIDMGLYGWISYEHAMYECTNCKLTSELTWNPDASKEEILTFLADKIYGKDKIESAIKMWNLADEAIKWFPFSLHWNIRNIASTASAVPFVPSLFIKGDDITYPVDPRFGLAEIETYYDTYLEWLGIMADKFKESCLEIKTLMDNPVDEQATRIDTDLISAQKCNTISAVNMIKFVGLIRRILNGDTGEDVVNRILELSNNEIENTGEFAQIIKRFPQGTTYIWWHPTVKEFTYDALVGKINLMKKWNTREKIEGIIRDKISSEQILEEFGKIPFKDYPSCPTV